MDADAHASQHLGDLTLPYGQPPRLGRGLPATQRHAVTLLTMPGRFWKWRMQGGPLELAQTAAQQLAAGNRPDVLLATDMLNAPAWLGLLRDRLPVTPPLVLYMHENQLTHPLQAGEKRDLTICHDQLVEPMRHARVLFNSAYHRADWFATLPNLLKHFPDFNHLARMDDVQARSHVLPVGLPCAEIRAAGTRPASSQSQPPLILWNQRWEYDKQPGRFFDLLCVASGGAVSGGRGRRKLPQRAGRVRGGPGPAG
ncbi:MAG: DUF3524 domain-containing protein [Caldilineaceae bacterium]